MNKRIAVVVVAIVLAVSGIAYAHTYGVPLMCTPDTVGESLFSASYEMDDDEFWGLLEQWHTLCIDGGTITPADSD